MKITTGKEASSKRPVTGSENARNDPSARENQGPLASSLKKGADNALEAAARGRTNEPEDCHLRELYAQVNQVANANPELMDVINEGEWTLWTFWGGAVELLFRRGI